MASFQHNIFETVVRLFFLLITQRKEAPVQTVSMSASGKGPGSAVADKASLTPACPYSWRQSTTRDKTLRANGLGISGNSTCTLYVLNIL